MKVVRISSNSNRAFGLRIVMPAALAHVSTRNSAIAEKSRMLRYYLEMFLRIKPQNFPTFYVHVVFKQLLWNFLLFPIFALFRSCMLSGDVKQILTLYDFRCLVRPDATVRRTKACSHGDLDLWPQWQSRS